MSEKLRPQPLRYGDIKNSPERHLSQEAGKRLLVNLMNGGEIAPTAFKLRLRCKLGKGRIEVPVRSVYCRPHFECMDLRNYLSYQAMNSDSNGATTSTRSAQQRLWTCVICGERAGADDLRVDDYFAHILESVPADVDEVLLLPDGSFEAGSGTGTEVLINDEERFEPSSEHLHIDPSAPSHTVKELLKQSKTFQRSLRNGEGLRTKKDLTEKVESYLEKERDALNALLKIFTSANQEQDSCRTQEPSCSKRGRGRSDGGALKSPANTPARKAKVDEAPTCAAQKDATEDEELEIETQNVPHMIFRNRKFVLTSINRVNRAGQPPFVKRLIRDLIKQFGGTVIVDFKGLGDDEEVYLIADTHYRTHKYLSALSLSVPCVHHTWITECVEAGTIIDCKKYMLPAGQAPDHHGTIREYEWKPLKGQLMAGKKVWIHSKSGSDFDELWSPIVSAVGAEVVRDDDLPQDVLELVEWLSNDGVEIVVTDSSCETLIVEAMEASECGEVVGSEWVIESLIAGELLDTNNARYRHNA
ncbi:Protein HSR-9 [Aphelenchoides avenae]|nr:Protein HSR-9 [Aphelenchus avenae]